MISTGSCLATGVTGHHSGRVGSLNMSDTTMQVDCAEPERALGIINADDKCDSRTEELGQVMRDINDRKLNVSGTGDCQSSCDWSQLSADVCDWSQPSTNVCDWSQPSADDTADRCSGKLLGEESSQGIDADDEQDDSSSSEDDWQEVEGLSLIRHYRVLFLVLSVTNRQQ